MRILIGADHSGLKLKSEIKDFLESSNIDFVDYGFDPEKISDYPDYAIPIAEQVASGEYDLGILLCGTGIGMSIAANKVKGIRCALVSDEYSARMSTEHNNSNILAIGERVVGPELAKSIVKAWLDANFMGERHLRRINKIASFEKQGQEVK